MANTLCHLFYRTGIPMDSVRTSLVFCKIKTYFTYVTSVLTPTLIVLACIDRLMLSSPKMNFRFWSQPRFAYRLAAAASIFWIAYSSHAFYGSVIVSRAGYSFCYTEEGSYRVFVTFHSVIMIYLLPPILMTILGALTIANVREAQRRVRPGINGEYGQRKDRHLLRMLLFQVLVNVIFTIPIAVYQVEAIWLLQWERRIFIFCCLDIRNSVRQLAERSSLANMGFIFD